jgi:hypothetical protein
MTDNGDAASESTSRSPGVGWLAFVFAIVVWIFDYFSGWDGIRIDLFVQRVTLGAINVRAPSIPLFARETLWRLFIHPLFWIPVIAYIVIKGIHLNKEEFTRLGSFMAMIYVPLAVLFLGGFSGFGILHLALAAAFYVSILRPYFGDEKIASARWSFITFLLIDFFGYGILNEYFLSLGIYTNRLILPIWVYGSLWFITKMKSTKLTSALWIFIIIFNMFILVAFSPVPIIDLTQTAGPERAQEAIEAAQTGFDNFKNWMGTLSTDIKKAATGQLEYATGGYYKGRVEENKDPNNLLGVYLENIEAADKSFYENEGVVIWGDLRARTLNKEIYVFMSCKSGDSNGKIIPEALANKDKGYKIDKFEQIGFECRFDGGQLKTGTNSVKIQAEFSFETLAFLKTYFMDVERMRSLRRENIDPLSQYGITDKKPSAVFTNGPVKLGMGTVDPPVGLGAGSTAYSYVGLTVERQWPGKIKNITGLGVQVPNVLQLESSGEDLFCRGDFKKAGEEEGYTVYELTDEAMRDIKTPITQFKSWRCAITIPEAASVLGNTPVTTYYYRANTTYVYEIEKSKNVYIKSAPKEKTKLTDCKINCTDTDGCICDTDGCNMPKGEDVGNKFSCNNYFGGCSNSGRSFEADMNYITALGQYIDAMITLNELCIRGDVGTINASINSRDDLKDNEKKQLKSYVLKGCESKEYNFFEVTEDLIVKRADCGVDIFGVLKRTGKFGDKKADVKTKKDEFNNLFGKIIEHFNGNYGHVVSNKNDNNIKEIEEKREELANIDFD